MRGPDPLDDALPASVGDTPVDVSPKVLDVLTNDEAKRVSIIAPAPG